ncbi:MAG: hypothetical protein QNK05_00540 [Myxococcota bacterium]|nr:hypothetical protein [Myxococcota bacterium]
MLRSLTMTALVVGLAVAGLAAPSFAERVRGTVLERTRHTLVVRADVGRTFAFERDRDLRVRGEVDRWRHIRRGDNVKVDYYRHRRHAVAERIKVLPNRLHKQYAYERRVKGEITRIGPFGMELLTTAGRTRHVRLTPKTLYFNTSWRRPLRDCDHVEVVLDPRRDRKHPKAVQVRRIDRRTERLVFRDSERGERYAARSDDRRDERRNDRRRRGGERRR